MKLTERPTPEVDAKLLELETHPDSDGVYYSYSELSIFARRLEQQRDAMREELEKLMALVEPDCGDAECKDCAPWRKARAILEETK